VLLCFSVKFLYFQFVCGVDTILGGHIKTTGFFINQFDYDTVAFSGHGYSFKDLDMLLRFKKICNISE